jgi:hypothetical protein
LLIFFFSFHAFSILFTLFILYFLYFSYYNSSYCYAPFFSYSSWISVIFLPLRSQKFINSFPYLFFLLLIEGITFFVLIFIIVHFHSHFVLILLYLFKLIINLTVLYFTNRSTEFHSVTEHPHMFSSSMTVQSPCHNQEKQTTEDSKKLHSVCQLVLRYAVHISVSC